MLRLKHLVVCLAILSIFGLLLGCAHNHDPEGKVNLCKECGPPVVMEVKAPAVPEFLPVYFNFDKAELTPQAVEILDDWQAYLNANPDLNANIISGYCDIRGSDEYNLVLSEKRAQACKDYLMEKGIDGKRISIISKGESELANTGTLKEDHAQNRRAILEVN